MVEHSTSSEVLFRPSKRRKFARKPAHADIDDAAAQEAMTELNSEAGDTGVILASRRKVGAGKSGISFSTNARRAMDTMQDEEQSLIVVGDGEITQIPGNDRFVKPTGRVGATEDRHMMAYVDSKLAESSPLTGYATSASSHIAPTTANHMTDENGMQNATSLPDTAHTVSNQAAAKERTVAHAQARGRDTNQRPTRRRGPPARKEEDVARDSMIEQIMGENHIPHYEQSAAAAAAMDAEDADDPDAAAEDAFKARLLADMELSNRRRRPTGKASAIAPTGPKLGGSRSQRERMKAMEETKAVGVKK